MPSDSRLGALHRDALLAVVALALLTAPLWVPSTALGATTYAYGSAQVATDDADGITYANDTGVPFRTYVSEDIACTNDWAVRPCAFERYLASNNTVPAGLYTSNPGAPHSVPIDQYGYAQVDGTVYETTYVANRSVRNDDGMYRVDLALEPTAPDDALRAVSLDASAEYADVPPVVVEAAREGNATSLREVEVPQTPIRLDDGSYYRVYADGSSDPGPFGRLLRTALSALGPLLGLVVGYRVSRRVEVTHVGGER